MKPTFVIICLVMFVGTIFMAVDIATSGAEISKLESDLALLEAKRDELKGEVIKNSSVSLVDAGAESLGFAKPENTIYLTVRDAASAYAR